MNNLLEQLRSLDPNDPGRWPLIFRVGAVAAILIVATAFGVYMFAWKPQKPLLQQAQAEEVTLFTTLEGKARKAANLEAYKAQLAEMERSFGAMLRQLPNRTEVPNLLVDISQTGLSAGLEEKLFQPSTEVKRDFYAELPIKIRLTGDFHAVGSFVSGIAALPRIVTLHDIQIQPVAKSSGDQLQIDVTAKTYRYLDDEEQAPAEKQPAQKKRAGAARS
ncbi:MAG: type 4a pilus biogenesis protein PilO [Steroidobacteraceae bacterium]